MIPHPVHVIMNLGQRHEEVLAECARQHRAKLAEQSGDSGSRRQLLDLLGTLVILVALVLLVAAGVSAA